MKEARINRRRRLVLPSLLALSLAAGALVAPSQSSATAHFPTRPGLSADVVDMGVDELRQLLQNRRVSSVDLVREYLRRIDAYENAYGDQPGVNAVIAVNPGALAEAGARDAERRKGRVRGPLHGIPILVKDNYDTHDLPTTNASEALAGLRPPDDATQIAKLRAAGAIIIAKTNLHEYASGITTISSLGGQTRNPYDQTRNPGGSSGGTGAGVAASFAPVGMGSDTCGSIRIPAAHNSLVGLRPSLGLSSRDGIAPMSATQDVGGPIGRSVRDVALVLDATVGYDYKDQVTAASIGQIPTSYTTALSTTALRGRRIGLFTDYLGTTAAEQPATDLIRRAAADLAAQGATVVEVGHQQRILDLISGSGVINDEFERDLNRYLAQPGIRFPKGLAELAEPRNAVTLADIVTSGKVTPTVLESLRNRLGRTQPTDAYIQRLANRTELQNTLRELISGLDLDAVLYPTVKQQAVQIPQSQPGSNCSMSANTGFPALTVPAGFTPDGMPIGAELLGLPFTEPTLLAMGYDYEQATRHRRPPASTPALAR
ncbi:amidase [Plantactinospora solaniradicis]|uniref:Amidase n=1 Tax=Plantactinospora solaniradicis TaxID=1723736 RepID=A0ABW1K7X0_9ACTN